MPKTQEKRPDRKTTRFVRYLTGKRRWSELTPTDRTKVARRCLRDFEKALEAGRRRKAFDHLQDARSLIREARKEVAGGELS